MFKCPTCSSPLEKSPSTRSDGLECEKCGGQTMSGKAFSHGLGHDFFKRSSRVNRARAGLQSRKCPSCSAIMDNYDFRKDSLNMLMRTCQLCDLVWFEGDARRELDSIISNEQPQEKLPATTPHNETPIGRIFSTAPLTSTGWKLVPALFGLPIECGESRLRRPPIATWSTAILVTVVLAMTMGISDVSALKKVVENWALIPGEAMRHGGLTFVTSFLLHGGWGHLLGNVYFLLIFGDDVEDKLGWLGFIGLLTAGHLGGMLLQMLVTSGWEIPIIGASAGISGVLGCYAIVRAQSKLGWVVFVPWRWRLTILRVPALAVLGGYAALQALSAIQAAEGSGAGVAYAAHLGGLAIGALWGLGVMHRHRAN